MHIINFTIGDWSNDGHNIKENYSVKSTHDVNFLRELHFKAPEIIGFDIGDICSSYCMPNLTDIQIEKLEEFGIIKEGAFNDETCLGSDDVVEIWLECLRYIARIENVENFSLEIAENISVYMHFYGVDHKKRYFNGPGYGVFSD